MVPGAVTAATVHGLAWPLVQERLNYLDAKLKIGPKAGGHVFIIMID